MHRNLAGPNGLRRLFRSAGSLRRRRLLGRKLPAGWAALPEERRYPPTIRPGVLGACCLVFLLASASSLHAVGGPRQEAVLPQQENGAAGGDAAPSRELLDRYCVACHNERVVQGRGGAASPLAAQLRAVGLTLDTLDLSNVGRDPDIWERVVRKLRAGAMPPAGRPRPDAEMRDAFLARLDADLDAAWAARADLPRTAVFHRLNRAEYANVIRDLLALDVDVASLLPPDDASYGFDNIADALGVSPLLLEIYIGSAGRISRFAVGSAAISPAISTYLVPTVLTQNDHLDGLPLGTRGGIAVRHRFPLDGEYVVRVRLLRTVIDTIRGLGEPHQLEVSLDGERVRLFTIGGAQPRADAFEVDDDADEEAREAARRAAREAALAYSMNADAALEVRLPVQAGTRTLAVAFLRKTSAQVATIRQPLLRSNIDPADTSGPPHVRSVAIGGPYGATGPGDTPSRRRLFVCRPDHAEEETACARRIMAQVARRAYRRPVTAADLQVLLGFYEAGRREGTFEDGIGRALQRVLVSPEFLFRIERDAPTDSAGTARPLRDLELASRLSFFLWSSIPDDELLDVAEAGRLGDPGVLHGQVRRMLRDPRSKALVDNFGGQWLYLRNLAGTAPDPIQFPDFDENLRQAMQRETELFFDRVIREDRSALEFLTSRTTFLNERLARHYGIPRVYGSHFRPVTLTDRNRSGVLGHASLLTATSYANRTSPVTRGKWILENIIGAPPPPPPPDIPELEEETADGRVRSMRERMEQHRKNPSCAVCHAQMDPLGLALENFDAVGRWRERSESDEPVDASGVLPDGTRFDGPQGLRTVLESRAEEFVTTLAEKLLTYAVGRGVELTDAPVVRRIVRDAAGDDYRFSSLIRGVVDSKPFRMRRVQP